MPAPHVNSYLYFAPLNGDPPMLTFAIAAQTVVLPDGTELRFGVNRDDTSIVEIRVFGKNEAGEPGTCVLPFRRNGHPLDPWFEPAPTAAPAPSQPPAPVDIGEASTEPAFRDYKSVDDDAVRSEPGKA